MVVSMHETNAMKNDVTIGFEEVKAFAQLIESIGIQLNNMATATNLIKSHQALV